MWVVLEPGTLVPVTDLAGASKVWNTFRDSRGLASSDMAPGMGLVLAVEPNEFGGIERPTHENMKEIAYLSYNGRAWLKTANPWDTQVLLLESVS